MLVFPIPVGDDGAIGIAIVGTVFFATLHPAGDRPEQLAHAFSHSLQAALLVNILFIVATLLIALPVPRQDPETQVVALAGD